MLATKLLLSLLPITMHYLFITLLKLRLLSEGVSEITLLEIIKETRALVLREIEYALSAKYPDKINLKSNMYEK